LCSSPLLLRVGLAVSTIGEVLACVSGVAVGPVNGRLPVRAMGPLCPESRGGEPGLRHLAPGP
jgi:hypothetical protein